MDLQATSGAIERTSTVDIATGIFALRYAKCSHIDPPVVYPRAAAGSEHLVNFIPVPDTQSTELGRPGQFLVIVSRGPARLDLILRGRASAMADVSVELENLSRAASPLKESAGVVYSEKQNDVPHGDARSDHDLAIVGHVANRGDVVATAGEWIAGPQNPAPIEGFSLRTAPGSACWFEAQVLVRGSRGWSAWQTAGEFVGSKGRAEPLTGVRLRLSSSAPADLDIQGSALFLGSPVIQRAGREIELRSAAGSDPLVGLALKSIRSVRKGLLSQEFPRVATGNGRVRVFRAENRRVSA